MWIALNQSSGDVAKAAATLATMWDVDPVATYSHMVTWVEDLCDAGVLERATAEAAMTAASAVGTAGHDEAMTR
ncbi:hypothetical protein [Kibdelosporangium persicum]|uniref:hypothetical protein n=1 Tax=Kibdelosporangium persicum TaxID=2698649 RepID=UPI00156559DE|nr:hypothetical protein [Kibdelosporangium persicum]